MKELHERTVLIPEVGDSEAREAFFQIMAILDERNCSVDEKNTLWKAYRKYVFFLLFKHGTIEDFSTPEKYNGFGGI